MKHHALIPCIIITAALWSGCTTSKFVYESIAGNSGKTLEIQGVRFRQKGSTEAKIGRTGYLADKSFLSNDQLVLPQGVSAKSQEIDLGAKESIGLDAMKEWMKARTGRDIDQKGKYLMIQADTVELMRAMNSPDNEPVLRRMLELDKPLVVTAILTVVSDSTQITSKDDITILEGGVFDITSSSEKTQKLSKDFTFAFSVAEICWQVVDGKLRVAQLTLDYSGGGMGSDCPGTATKSTRKVKELLSGKTR